MRLMFYTIKKYIPKKYKVVSSPVDISHRLKLFVRVKSTYEAWPRKSNLRSFYESHQISCMNRPQGQGHVLSDQDAVDVSYYFTQKPRPDFPAKVNDWPSGKKPKDSRY